MKTSHSKPPQALTIVRAIKYKCWNCGKENETKPAQDHRCKCGGVNDLGVLI